MTSQKLTTGVDACNVRSIVLMREIQQKTERQEYDVLDITLDLVYAVPTLDHALYYYSDIQHWLYAAWCAV